MVTTFADDVAGLTRDLLLSLWAELGIEGAPRRHDWLAIDLEPLIVFTVLFADAALRARTIDWCAVNRRHLSLARLNHFSWLFGQVPRQAFKRYTAALAGGGRSAGRPTPRPRNAHSSAAPDLRRPSLIQLRLRALVGMSARAEVLKLLLAEPDEPRSAASLGHAAGCGKGGLAQALDSLTDAGIASSETEGQRTVYRLNRPSELAMVLSGLPVRYPDWPAVFLVVGAILNYSRAAGRGGTARVEAAAGAIEQMREPIGRVPGALRPPRVTDDASALAFERWARDFVMEQAGTQVRLTTKRELTYTVHRLLVGGWIATVKEEGDESRPLALSDDPELDPDRRAHRRLNLDELGAAADVMESIFYDLRTRDVRRRRGSVVPRGAVSEARLPAMSRVFAAELMSPMRKGQAATFTEEFLQRWSANHLLTAAG